MFITFLKSCNKAVGWFDHIELISNNCMLFYNHGYCFDFVNE